nr:uncharacterized protein LOC112545207 [Pelodiscus sinensis]|eukprot:XP_025038644.1 uncharacterized protein LOC112545207 [Pelodiscus sinensis]
MGNARRHIMRHLPTLGDSLSGPLRNSRQRKMPQVLHQSGPGLRISRGCLPRDLARTPPLCISPHTSHSQGPSEADGGQGYDNPHSPRLASPALVPIPASPLRTNTDPPSASPRPPHTSPRTPETSPDTNAEPNSMVPNWLNPGESVCSAAVQNVLVQSRRQTTRKTYLHKWHGYSSWCTSNHHDPARPSISSVLDYALHLKNKGLVLASIRVHLAAISAFTSPVDGVSIFAHPTTKRFLKGLINMDPPRNPVPPVWSLDVVLDALMRPPFEPLVTVSLRFLTLKTVFLLAITSARRVSELSAMMAIPPYTIFRSDGVVLRLHPRFLPKIVSNFHVNEPVILPTFFPKPHASPRDVALHSLDICRALAFYIDRTKPFRLTDHLFVSLTHRSKGQCLSSQRISNLITACIVQLYAARGLPLPSQPHAHSTRAMAISTAFHRGVSLKDICRTAAWSSHGTFAKHYSISLSHSDGAVATAVLSTCVVRPDTATDKSPSAAPGQAQHP